MAHIVVITHAGDDFVRRGYLLHILSRHWSEAGHKVSVAAGEDRWPGGDLAILHVDLSVVPGPYARAAKQYGIVLNGRARDIRKRLVSRNLLGPKDDWGGPVIIKTDLNCGGLPEFHLHRMARQRGEASGAPGPEPFHLEHPYEVLPSLRQVPAAVWRNPGLVVEKFLPEQDKRGYWLRCWVFFGDRERCTRYLSNERIVKGGNVLAREKVPVPAELRAERERLGFDYGKFDFVVRDGQAILLDANRTPSNPPRPDSAAMKAANARLARGIDEFLKGR